MSEPPPASPSRARRAVGRLPGVARLRAMQERIGALERRLDDVEVRTAADRRPIETMLAALEVEAPELLGPTVRERLDHTLRHADAIARSGDVRHETDIAELRRALRLAEAAARAPAAVDRGPVSAPAAATAPAPVRRNAAPTFDQLYRAFEDQHRGGDDVIRERQEADYLTLLRELPQPTLPVVDLGCGRGELVELLNSHGVRAVGIDANAGQLLDGAAERFVAADLFDWLDDQADGSHRAVVSLHVVEHLPTDLAVRLMFEAYRILTDGGALVLETPNALSLTTAATNFWVDPTHERPVHPSLLEFLARQAGFHSIELLPLHAVPLSFQGEAQVPELVEELNSLLFGSGDIALIARR